VQIIEGENMEELDITKYKAYKDYKGKSKFKSVKEKKMSWPLIDKKYILENKFVIRLIEEQEIDEIVQVYREGFPDLYNNNIYDAVLYSERLNKKLQCDNGFMKGDCILIVVEKIDEKKLVGAAILTMNISNMSVHWETGVIHKDYRRHKIFGELLKFLDRITEDTGAEYANATSVTFHSATQKVLESLGWKTRGIFPGAVATWNFDDKYYRQSLIYFDKLYNGAEELIPKDMELTPRMEKVVDCLKLD
jgi:hypothetical protein